MIYDVIIVGAGASGLFTMANLKKGLKAICIEKNTSAGKKLLLTGGGKCNLTSTEDIKEMIKAYDPASFVRKILYGFTNRDLVKWFEERGIKTYRQGKKIFPVSDNAKTVLDCLLYEIKKREFQILYRHEALTLKRDEQGLSLQVKDHFEGHTRTLKCKTLVVASGGRSFPHTGSDGAFLTNNFSITPFDPSLTPLYIKEDDFRELAGVGIDGVKLRFLHGKEYEGDLLFAGRYLSGPVILNASCSFNASCGERSQGGHVFHIDFLPEFTREELFEKLSFKSSDKRLFKTVFIEVVNLPKRFLEVLLKKHHLTEKKVSQMSKKELRLIIEDLKAFRFTISQKASYHIAMSSIGGISTEDVDAKSMSLKSDHRIKILGEALDIAAFTGGYHLQFAFSSAFLAANDIK